MNKLTNCFLNNYIVLISIIILGTLYFLTLYTFPYFSDDISFLFHSPFHGMLNLYSMDTRIGLRIYIKLVQYKALMNMCETLVFLLTCYLIFFYSFSKNLFNSMQPWKNSIYYVLIFFIYVAIGHWEAQLFNAAFFVHAFSIFIILGCFIPFYYLLFGKDVLLKRYWLILLMLLSIFPMGSASYTSVPLWLVIASLSVLFYVYKYKKLPFIHIFYILGTFIFYYVTMFVFRTYKAGYHEGVSLINSVYNINFFYFYCLIFSGVVAYLIYLMVKNKNIKCIVFNNNLILLKSCLFFLVFLLGLSMFIIPDWFAPRYLVFVTSLLIISVMLFINFIDISLTNKYRKVILYPTVLFLLILCFYSFYDNYIIRAAIYKSASESYFANIQEQAKGLTENDILYVDNGQIFSNVYPEKYRTSVFFWGDKTLIFYRMYANVKPQLKLREKK